MYDEIFDTIAELVMQHSPSGVEAEINQLLLQRFAALEVEVAAYAVHARIWPEAGATGDSKLRSSYHDILTSQITVQPRDILDLGCSVGLSTFALGKVYPQAKITGLDLSPYFLAVAHYQSQQRQAEINWVHAAAEATGLPTNKSLSRRVHQRDGALRSNFLFNSISLK